MRRGLINHWVCLCYLSYRTRARWICPSWSWRCYRCLYQWPTGGCSPSVCCRRRCFWTFTAGWSSIYMLLTHYLTVPTHRTEWMVLSYMSMQLRLWQVIPLLLFVSADHALHFSWFWVSTVTIAHQGTLSAFCTLYGLVQLFSPLICRALSVLCALRLFCYLWFLPVIGARMN